MNQSKLVKLLESMSSEPQKFPNPKVDYFKRFRDVEKYLNETIHKHTTAGAMAEQLSQLSALINAGASSEDLRTAAVKNNAWLTDHGPDHVDTVIDRASELVFEAGCELLPYEVYVLLMAAHFHDVGNIYGREGHEKQISTVMASMERSLIGDDYFERRLIRDIAMAHGGNIGGDKNTIGRLPYEKYIEKPGIRPHFLAAILRFADELADDSRRATVFPLEHDFMLKASEVFQRYAEALKRVEVNADCIQMRFELDRETVLRKYGKGGKEVYLLDEIFERTLKTYLEHIYCSRFLQPEIHISRIEVLIEVFSDNFMTQLYKVRYVLQESGYPKRTDEGIYGVVTSDLTLLPENTRLDGESLKKHIEEMMPV